MKTLHTLGRASCWSLCLALAAVLLTTDRATADDMFPPPWRDLAHPYSTFQAWEFLTPDNPLAPDGQLVGLPLVTGDGGPNPHAPFAQMIGLQYDAGTPGWHPPGIDPGEIQLSIPNWIDFEPLKLIRVQMNFLGGFIDDNGNFVAPFVGGIEGLDNVVGLVTGTPVAPPVLTPLDPFGTDWHWYQDWEIVPNPDWELIRIVVPRDNIVYEIVVDTISIPEPSTLVLGTIAMFAVGLVAGRARRRNA